MVLGINIYLSTKNVTLCDFDCICLKVEFQIVGGGFRGYCPLDLQGVGAGAPLMGFLLGHCPYNRVIYILS